MESKRRDSPDHSNSKLDTDLVTYVLRAGSVVAIVHVIYDLLNNQNGSLIVIGLCLSLFFFSLPRLLVLADDLSRTSLIYPCFLMMGYTVWYVTDGSQSYAVYFSVMFLVTVMSHHRLVIAFILNLPVLLNLMSNHWLYRTLHPVSLREDPVGLVLITPLCMAMALIHYMKARNDQDGVLASDDNQTDVGLGPESSAQKKAFSKSLDYFLDQLPVGIAIKDVRHDYAVIHWNKKIERMFGIPKESILGRNYSMLTNELDEDWVVHSRTMAHLASKKGKPLERTKETVITKHGKRSFDVLRFEVQGQDRNEHLLVGLYKESSFEIEKDYNAVAKEKLFQRIINHDIRNALNDLIGLPDLIFDHLDAGNNTRVKNMLDEIDKKAKSLTVFMDEIPDKGLNRMGLPHEQALINIRELVEEGILFFDEISRVKNTTILNKVDSNINMKLDGYAFRLVLRNLLSNAVKFSHSKSTIHVESRETEDELILTVVDHGVGIAPDKLSKIFDSYEGKSTPGTAGERGSGIGLSLLKQLLELEGDTIKIESTLNVGTKVTVHFQKFT